MSEIAPPRQPRQVGVGVHHSTNRVAVADGSQG